MLDWLIKFQRMDRRWVFLGMAVAILIPLLWPLKLPFRVDKEVRDIYQQVEKLPEGSAVLISGRVPWGNSISATGPITWVIRPLGRSVCSTAAAIVFLSLEALVGPHRGCR